jgi:hypothetical protein
LVSGSRIAILPDAVPVVPVVAAVAATVAAAAVVEVGAAAAVVLVGAAAAVVLVAAATGAEVLVAAGAGVGVDSAPQADRSIVATISKPAMEVLRFVIAFLQCYEKLRESSLAPGRLR